MPQIKINICLTYESEIDKDTLEDLVLLNIDSIQVIEHLDGVATCDSVEILDGD